MRVCVGGRGLIITIFTEWWWTSTSLRLQSDCMRATCPQTPPGTRPPSCANSETVEQEGAPTNTHQPARLHTHTYASEAIAILSHRQAPPTLFWSSCQCPDDSASSCWHFENFLRLLNEHRTGYIFVSLHFTTNASNFEKFLAILGFSRIGHL